MVTAPSHRQDRSLVTGVTGFAGCYLADALLARGEVVIGLSRRAAWPIPWRRHLAERVDLRECDLCNAAQVEDVLRQTQPARVYHLAGFAQVGSSFRDPEAAWNGNLLATRQLCEAVIRWGGRPRILFVGSGLIYGNKPDAGPYHEECPLRPDTPYAASKAAADLACYQYTCAPGLDIVRARPFNHIGPHQGADFALPNFARQIAAIEQGAMPAVLETGNLAAQRDLTDVRDMVTAYLLLMEYGRPGEAYNIGSGQTVSMQTVVERLLALASVRVEIRLRADLVRPTEQAIVRVDAGKLRRETGWAPRYSLEETLTDTLNAWRQQGQPEV